MTSYLTFSIGTQIYLLLHKLPRQTLTYVASLVRFPHTLFHLVPILSLYTSLTPTPTHSLCSFLTCVSFNRYTCTVAIHCRPSHVLLLIQTHLSPLCVALWDKTRLLQEFQGGIYRSSFITGGSLTVPLYHELKKTLIRTRLDPFFDL